MSVAECLGSRAYGQILRADAGPDCNVWFYRAVQSVETVLQQGTPFTHAKVALWQATIVENALKRLAAQNKPFKYVGKL